MYNINEDIARFRWYKIICNYVININEANPITCYYLIRWMAVTTAVQISSYNL